MELLRPILNSEYVEIQRGWMEELKHSTSLKYRAYAACGYVAHMCMLSLCYRFSELSDTALITATASVSDIAGSAAINDA